MRKVPFLAAKLVRRVIAPACAAAVLAGCGSSDGDNGGQAATEVPPQGVALAGTLAGGVAAASVTAYALNADGSNGALLGSTTSGADGTFRIALAQPPAGGVRIAASGGSYASAADTARTVQGIAWSAVLPQVAADGESGLVLSPLSTFVDRRFVPLLGQAVAPATALDQSDAFVRSVYGLQGAGTPIHRLLPDFRAASGPAAAFAFALGGLEELALLFARSPLDILRAVGEDLADGTVDGRTVGGAAIRYDAATAAPATLAGGSYLSALIAYLAPSSTQTVLARNGVTPDATAVASVENAVAASIRLATGTYGNNGAVLEGAQVGSGVAAAGELRKTIAATYTGSLPLAFGTATAMRSGRGSDAMYVAVPVTNTGSAMMCFVQLTGLTYRNTAGNALAAGTSSFVNGSIGLVGSGRTSTDTCLQPGGTGFFLDISTSISWAAVSRMEFGATVSNSSSTPSLAALIPQSYRVSAPSTLQSLNVTVANVGSAPARLVGTTFSKWLVLDAASQPLMWGFATDGPSNVLVAVGATTAVASSTLLYEGAGTRLLVQVDFDDAATAAAGQATREYCAASAATTPAFDACMHAARMQGTMAAQRTAERSAAQ